MPRARSIVNLAILFTLAGALTACGGSKSSSGGASGAGSAGATGGPGATLQKMYMAANEGKYTVAEPMMAPESLALFKNIGSKDMWDDITKKGTLKQVEVLKEEVRGEGATVNVRFHYKDGSVMDQETSMIKVNGKWLFQH